MLSFHDVEEIAASAAIRPSDCVIEIKDVSAALDHYLKVDWESLDLRWDRYLIISAEAIEAIPEEARYSGILDKVCSVLDILDKQRSTHLLLEIAKQVLDHWGLESLAERMVSSLDGIAILANCCNAAAKIFNPCLYGYKPYLVKQCAAHPGTWQRDGIVYIETAIKAQVSFHVFEGEDDGLPEANGREWSGMHLQDFADSLAIMYIAGVPLTNLFAMSVDEGAAL